MHAPRTFYEDLHVHRSAHAHHERVLAYTHPWDTKTHTLGVNDTRLGTPSDEWVVGQVYDSEKDLTEDVVAIDGIVYSLQVLARCIAPCRSPSYLPRGYAVRQ
jgi:hypothetical protein